MRFCCLKPPGVVLGYGSHGKRMQVRLFALLETRLNRLVFAMEWTHSMGFGSYEKKQHV